MGAESLGVEYLSAIAKRAGHETSLWFDPALFGGHLMWNVSSLASRLDLASKITDGIIREQPDVAAFSCFTGNFRWAVEIATEVKKKVPEIKIVLGGVHVTAAPETAIDEAAVDAIAIGEADSSFPILLDKWQTGGTETPAGIWEKNSDGSVSRGPAHSFPEDLDAVPMPDKKIFYHKAPALERHYMIMSARGCPYNCTYCYKSLSAALPPGTKPIRRRSVDNVLHELEHATSGNRVKMVVFRDDVFTLQKKWLEDFTEKYIEKIHLPYFCYTHPAAIDRETASLIRRGGCTFVTMGVQAVDEKLRREVLNRRYTNDQVREAVKILKEQNIAVSIDHIAGIPGETDAMLGEAARFYNELRPERLLAFWLTYYPGTEIVDVAVKHGILSKEDRDELMAGHAGYRYSGGGGKEKSAETIKLVSMMGLVPILPKNIVAFILKHKLYRLLPKGFWFNNILLSLNAVVHRDPFFFYNLKFMLSRKNVP